MSRKAVTSKNRHLPPIGNELEFLGQRTGQTTMNEKLRAYWFHKQGLDGSYGQASPADVLHRSGWARSVGGANPYLALFSRAGISKDAAEKALRDVHIHELPSARGCTYVVPEQDYAMALLMGRGTGDPADLAVAKKWLGVTEEEIERLEAAVIDSLRHGPLDPKEIRDAAGDAVRSLGDEGKKRGQTTTLPLALGLLQSEGHIRRIPSDGRLDQQRYKYTLWDPSPMEGYVKTLEETYIVFARRYFAWIGPATKESYRGISGQGVKAAEQTLAEVDLEPIEPGSPLLILKEERDAFDAFLPPMEACYALVSCLDSLSHLHWGIQFLKHDLDADRPAFGPKGMTTFGGMNELENHAIYDRGRIVGLWEYDPDVGEIVWTPFIEPDQALRSAIRAMESFARELGDVRSFSLDSPESRKPRLDALRRS